MKATVNGKPVYPDYIQENGVLLISDGKIIAGGNIPVPAGTEVIDAPCHGLFLCLEQFPRDVERDNWIGSTLPGREGDILPVDGKMNVRKVIFREEVVA